MGRNIMDFAGDALNVFLTASIKINISNATKATTEIHAVGDMMMMYCQCDDDEGSVEVTKVVPVSHPPIGR